jgi:hypothetical protein
VKRGKTKSLHSAHRASARSRCEGVEVVLWLIMRGAHGAGASELNHHYHVPASNTARRPHRFGEHLMRIAAPSLSPRTAKGGCAPS